MPISPPTTLLGKSSSVEQADCVHSNPYKIRADHASSLWQQAHDHRSIERLLEGSTVKEKKFIMLHRNLCISYSIGEFVPCLSWIYRVNGFNNVVVNEVGDFLE
ncbi:hypothetical protein ACS0TY_028247 [Phlomoides rotata]